ncbi:MAG: hypothetical protein LBN74_07640 [Prevotella sp.]|jgi:hypothetical protein|nr:hypothetical protein [Prevotella sp.]
MEKRMNEDARLENEKIKSAFFEAIEKGDIKVPAPYSKEEGHIYYPWDHVIACKYLPMQDDDYGYISDEMDSDRMKICWCNSKMFWMLFRSPQETWRGLCGREGYLLICPHCIRQVYFRLTIMS